MAYVARPRGGLLASARIRAMPFADPLAVHVPREPPSLEPRLGPRERVSGASHPRRRHSYDEATGVLTHQRGASFTDIPKP